jgi:hypothetical protein
MELATIQMPKEQAQAALEEYRAAVRAAAEHDISDYETRASKRRAELEEADKQIVVGYQALAKGKQVISLRATMLAGGEDDLHRPRLAIGRADETAMRLTRYANGRVDLDPVTNWARGDNQPPWDHAATSRRFQFLGLLPAIDIRGSVGAEAILPHIPPAIRPRTLDRYFVLWEADWQRLAPVDPALLRPVGGDLYVVVATWDLTDLERAVLNG